MKGLIYYKAQEISLCIFHCVELFAVFIFNPNYMQSQHGKVHGTLTRLTILVCTHVLLLQGKRLLKLFPDDLGAGCLKYAVKVK